MPIDFLTVGVGFFSFGVFLVIHVVTFRWLQPEKLLKSLLACSFAIAALPLVLMGSLFVMKTVDASALVWAIASLLALLITGLLSFIYVTCIFGPYETSVRMRLVREIANSASKGISRQELRERYNAQTIMNIRLRRLQGAGDIIEQNGFYRAGSSRNIFFLFDTVARVIKKWME
jgi:hypothetical protein